MGSVLIIDDEEINYVINSQIIKRAGFKGEIIYFDSAISALQFLESTANKNDKWPSKIFLDISMPHMSGFGFIEMYLKLPEVESRNTEIYIVSSSSSFQDINKAKEYPVVRDYFTKPLSADLVKKVFNQEE